MSQNYRFLAGSHRLQKAVGQTRGGNAKRQSDRPAAMAMEQDAAMDLGLKTLSASEASDSTSAFSHLHTATPGSGKIPSAADICQLQDKVQALVAEKESIQRAQSEQQERLESQRAAWLEERAALVGGAGTSAADKIVRLSKRNRELSAEIAAEKNQSSRLKQSVKDLKASLLERDRVVEKKPVDVQEAENQLLRDQVSGVTSKMTDYRNQCQKHKQDLRVMNKLLIKELGDGVDLQKIIAQERDTGNGWRGRQQQVTALQAKVSELQHALKTSRRKAEIRRSGQSPGPDLPQDGKSDAQEHAAFADPRQVDTLHRMDKMKRQAAKETQAELAALQSSHQQLQQRYDGSRARCQTLTNQMQTLKGQLERLQSKSERDDHILKSLSLSSPRLHLSPRKPELGGENSTEDGKLKGLCAQQAQDIHQLQCKVLALQRQVQQQQQQQSQALEDLTIGQKQEGRTKLSVGSSRVTKKPAGVSSLSTVSLPSINTGSLTAQKEVDIKQFHEKALPRIAKLDLTSSSSSSSSSRASEMTARSSSLVEALKTERDHLRQLTSKLLEENNTLTQAPGDSVAEGGIAQAYDGGSVTQLQLENRQLRVALSKSHQAKVTALQQFKRAIDEVMRSHREH